MKRQFLLLTVSSVLLASCGSNTNNNQAQKAQTQIDSTVNANLAKRDAENARKNDSIINAAAKLKAEAEEKAPEHAAKSVKENKTAPKPAQTGTEQGH